MSRLYDTVEPSVIDEDMLQNAVEEQGPKDEAGRLAKSEGIDFADVLSLRLDFKNILKIDNLWCFTSVTKLQLDNNIIEKIEGLDKLVNLVWLDLSFNNIEVIEGLDSLVKLEDLTFYNNRISRIENMDKLVNLQVFSIGNNDLKELENLVYLRRFKNLQTLNLSGNPLCEDEHYVTFVTSHLPQLEYLDYRLIHEGSRDAGREKYLITIEELQHDERQADRKAAEVEAKEKEHQLHKNAYVENLDGPQLFEAMYAEDSEGQKLNSMPGVEEMLLTYKERFTSICQQIFTSGLKKHEEVQTEVSLFWQCVEDAKNDNKIIGMEQINTFMEYKKHLFLEVTLISDQTLLANKMEEYSKQVSTLWDTLMGYELQLVDQLEDVIKDFERNLADVVASFVEHVQGLTSQMRDLENMHHEKLLELSIISLEKVLKNELDEEIPDDLRELFVDKDTIINAVTTSHDVHLLKIDNREDDIITRINQWMSHMMEEIHEREEIKRNRSRVSEINNLIDHLRDDIDNLDLQGGNY